MKLELLGYVISIGETEKVTANSNQIIEAVRGE